MTRPGWLASGLAMALCIATGGVGHARDGLAAPQGEWVLTRVLTRGLSDGQAIVVTRAWTIHFTASDTGLSVDGAQRSAEVEAPARLAPLARLERERKETDMFPAQLDMAGRIVAMPRAANDRSLAELVQTALKMLREQGETGAELADKRKFLIAVQHTAAAAVSQVPPDLFYPASASRSDEQDLRLPDGETGHIAVTMTAKTRGGSGLLDHSLREVTTTIAGRQRYSSESWSLTPLK